MQIIKNYWYWLLKGYLHYKTITSQNVLSEAQVKNIFILWKYYAPFSRYSSFCIFNHRMIYQICYIICISTWDRVHFWVYLLNHNPISHHTWPTDRYKQGQYFSAIFRTIRTGAKFQVLSNLANCFKYSTTSYVKILKRWKRDN